MNSYGETTGGKPKVLILISHFLPGLKIGGPLASNLNIIRSLSGHFDFSVITSDRDMQDKEPYPGIETNRWTSIEGIEICYVSGRKFRFWNAIKMMRSRKFDVVYINSFFDVQFSILIAIARYLGLLPKTKLIIAPRGEFVDGNLFFKKGRKLLFLRLARLLRLYNGVYWHASTNEEKSGIVETIGLKNELVNVAMNIPDVGELLQVASDCPAKGIAVTVLTGQAGRPDALKLVYLARVAKEKNLQFALRVLEKVQRPVDFDIYGPIEDEGIWQNCLEIIQRMPDQILVRYCGTVPRSMVKEKLAAYHLFFLPTLGENFGHVIVESLCAGTPVLISDQTPWRNLEGDRLGWDLDLNCPEEFARVIEQFDCMDLESDLERRQRIRQAVLDRLNYPEIIRSNFELFNYTHS